MKPSSLTVFAFSLLLSSPALSAFDLVDCLSNNSKAECTRRMLIEDALSKPLADGDSTLAESGKYRVTIKGEGWLRNGWSGNNKKAKDLGLIRDNGEGVLNFEPVEIAPADFENTLTTDMQGIYQGLQEGFQKGKIEIKSNSDLEILPLTIAGASAQLGRFCYTIEAGNRKSACVYEGFIHHTSSGKSYKLLGSTGDYNNMRQEMEAVISSFTFTE